jgi:hypothetical protein
MVCGLLCSDLDDDIATIQQIQRPMQESAANFFYQLFFFSVFSNGKQWIGQLFEYFAHVLIIGQR